LDSEIRVSSPDLKDCCDIGADLFDQEPHYFSPPSPGPFKRAAAFLVIGCIVHPFIDFVPSRHAHRRAAFPRDERAKKVWRVRLMILMLAAVFDAFKVSIDDGWEKVRVA